MEGQRRRVLYMALMPCTERARRTTTAGGTVRKPPDPVNTREVTHVYRVCAPVCARSQGGCGHHTTTFDAVYITTRKKEACSIKSCALLTDSLWLTDRRCLFQLLAARTWVVSKDHMMNASVVAEETQLRMYNNNVNDTIAESDLRYMRLWESELATRSPRRRIPRIHEATKNKSVIDSRAR